MFSIKFDQTVSDNLKLFMQKNNRHMYLEIDGKVWKVSHSNVVLSSLPGQDNFTFDMINFTAKFLNKVFYF